MKTVEKATFGGGCFWCIEALFTIVKGVEQVVSGYGGGSVPGYPTYREVCSGRTGHAEVVQVTFCPELISYERLLTLFMTVHDPTTTHTKGVSIGNQYRSVIYTHNNQQQQSAVALIETLRPRFEKPIMTEIATLKNFYLAEAYHQKYFEKKPEQAYCQTIIRPKLKAFQREHPEG